MDINDNYKYDICGDIISIYCKDHVCCVLEIDCEEHPILRKDDITNGKIRKLMEAFDDIFLEKITVERHSSSHHLIIGGVSGVTVWDNRLLSSDIPNAKMSEKYAELIRDMIMGQKPFRTMPRRADVISLQFPHQIKENDTVLCAFASREDADKYYKEHYQEKYGWAIKTSCSKGSLYKKGSHTTRVIDFHYNEFDISEEKARDILYTIREFMDGDGL